MRMGWRNAGLRLVLGFVLTGVLHAGEPAPIPPFRIVASFYPMWLAVRQIADGIEGVEVVNLTRPTVGCLHDYALTTEDMKRLSGASVLVINGLGMESFLDRLLQRVPVPVINASEGLPGIEMAEGEEEEETTAHASEHGHVHEEGVDPHVWLSVTLHIGQVSNIVAGLSRLDPARAERYRLNGERYVTQLADLRRRLREELNALRSRTIITFHPAFTYFAREFDIRVAAVITPDPATMPTPREMTRLIRLIQEQKVPAVFLEPTTPPRLAETLVRETGVRTAVLDPITVGPEDPDTYLRRMEQNARILREQLGTAP